MRQGVAPEQPPPVLPDGASRRELVLCAIDDDHHAMDVLATAAHLAAAGRVDLVFVHVAGARGALPVNAGLAGVDEVLRTARERGEGVLRRLGLGGAEQRVVVGLWPGRALRAAAVSFGASAIVVGAGRGGPLRRVLGRSVTDDIVRGAPVPVVVARPSWALARAGGPVVALGGGATVVRWATRLARLVDRPLVLGDEGDAGDAGLLVVPRAGRVLGRGRRARRLAARSRAPIAVLPVRG